MHQPGKVVRLEPGRGSQPLDDVEVVRQEDPYLRILGIDAVSDTLDAFLNV